MKQVKFCVCGHNEYAHHNFPVRGGECFHLHCLCSKFRLDKTRLVEPVSRYSLGTPPPDYSPSPEPEPLRW